MINRDIVKLAEQLFESDKNFDKMWYFYKYPPEQKAQALGSFMTVLAWLYTPKAKPNAPVTEMQTQLTHLNLGK